MIPFFSIIDTPGQLITQVAGLLFCGVISYMGGVVTTKKHLNTIPLLWAVAGAIFFVLLSWILIGDSTEWSKPIGLWLQGK